MKVFLVSAIGLALFLSISTAAWSGCTEQSTLASGKARAWEHINCGGWYLDLNINTNASDLRKWGGGNINVNDMISSIQIGSDIKCEFYEHINFKGSKLGPLSQGDYPDLTKNKWNDKISSLKCYSSSP